MSRRFACKSKAISHDHLQQAVATLVGIKPEELVGASKASKVAKGRILLCCLAVRQMGLSKPEIASRLKIALSIVSGVVQKGEDVARAGGWIS